MGRMRSSASSEFLAKSAKSQFCLDCGFRRRRTENRVKSNWHISDADRCRGSTPPIWAYAPLAYDFCLVTWPLLYGLFLRHPTPLDRLCDPGAAFRRQVPLLLRFRSCRYCRQQSVFRLARPASIPWSGAPCRVILQPLASFFQSRNF
jgi:hypothetical protein